MALQLKCIRDVSSPSFRPAVVALCSSTEDEGCLTFISMGFVLGWKDLSMRLQSGNMPLPTQLLWGRAQPFLAAEHHYLLSWGPFCQVKLAWEVTEQEKVLVPTCRDIKCMWVRRSKSHMQQLKHGKWSGKPHEGIFWAWSASPTCLFSTATIQPVIYGALHSFFLVARVPLWIQFKLVRLFWYERGEKRAQSWLNLFLFSSIAAFGSAWLKW